MRGRMRNRATAGDAVEASQLIIDCVIAVKAFYFANLALDKLACNDRDAMKAQALAESATNLSRLLLAMSPEISSVQISPEGMSAFGIQRINCGNWSANSRARAILP